MDEGEAGSAGAAVAASAPGVVLKMVMRPEAEVSAGAALVCFRNFDGLELSSSLRIHCLTCQRQTRNNFQD